ncbi:MAG: radical SAM/SPASM domain-containing protein, partial [Microthrixaceae bacterium]
MEFSRLPAVLRSSTLAIRQRSSLPQTLIFFVTARCNARCDFCLYKDSVENPTRRSEELSVEEVNKIARAYGPLHYLALSGGEPFVRKDVGDICQAFIDHCGTSVIGIPSNFAYGDVMLETIEPLVARNPNVVIELQMSIDHLGAQHDQSRGIEGLFESAVATFQKLEAVRDRFSNLSLKVNLVWLERNRDDVDSIVAGLRSRLKVDRIHLTFPHERLEPDGASPEQVAEFDRFWGPAESVSSDSSGGRDLFTLPMRAAKVSAHRILREAMTGETPMGSICEAGKHLVVIDERGEVFPCETIWESVGNLRDDEYQMSKVLSGSRYASFREQYLGPNSCNCTWSCAAMTAVSVSVRRYP